LGHRLPRKPQCSKESEWENALPSSINMQNTTTWENPDAYQNSWVRLCFYVLAVGLEE